MTEDQDAKDSQSDSGTKTFTNKNKDKKTKAQRPLTKIILRRLPPTMTEEALLEQVSPIPEHDYFYFSKPDPSLGHNVYSRAYINFVNVEDIFIFKDKFDGYVFLDEKGVEYVGIVEYAPFQRIPKKKKKKDPKCGTVESDPIYQDFIESLTKEQETDNQPKLEYSYPVNDSSDKKVQSTPLLEYLAARKQDKRGRDERRRRENDKRKMRIERKTKEVPIKEDEIGDGEVKKIKSREREKEKVTESKEEKPDSKDVSVFESKTYRERKSSSFVSDKKKKDDKKINKEDEFAEDSDKGYKKEKREKLKESPREPKSKKYSDTRKERIKQNEFPKSEKQSLINKMMAADGKPKSMNHDDIKPFTQLPQVKTDDLTKIIEEMDKKLKIEEGSRDTKVQSTKQDNSDKKSDVTDSRKNSLESAGTPESEESLKRHKSMDDRSKSTDREGSEEKEKYESADRRTERRIRNKDRPSIVIYQPGMGKFSKQRLAKEKDTTPVNDSEKKDT